MLQKITLIAFIISSSFMNAQVSIAKALKSGLVENNDCSSVGGTKNTNFETLVADYEIPITSSKKHFSFQLKTNISIPDNSTSADELLKIETGAENFVVSGISGKGKTYNDGCNKTLSAAKELRFVIEFTGAYVLGETKEATFTLASILKDEKISTSETVNRTLTLKVTGVQAEDAASIDDLKQYGFNFGPNPSADFLGLNAAASIETASVKNLMGQTLINKVLGNKNARLDISTLNAGIYIVEVTINGAKGSFQFVKS
jgi:hypothetical protein